METAWAAKCRLIWHRACLSSQTIDVGADSAFVLNMSDSMSMQRTTAIQEGLSVFSTKHAAVFNEIELVCSHALRI